MDATYLCVVAVCVDVSTDLLVVAQDNFIVCINRIMTMKTIILKHSHTLSHSNRCIRENLLSRDALTYGLQKPQPQSVN